MIIPTIFCLCLRLRVPLHIAWRVYSPTLERHDDPDDDSGAAWTQLTPEQTLELLKDARRCMLRNSIGLVEMVPERAVTAGLEVLRDALADVDAWADGMAAVLERDRLASLDELRQH